jgi:hypothetical protein
LGKIATPEAVDLIIKNLDSYLAPEALYQTKSEKALPALKAHLQVYSDDINRAATRVAIIRLSEKQPQEALLAMGEASNEKFQVRFDALRALRGRAKITSHSAAGSQAYRSGVGRHSMLHA